MIPIKNTIVTVVAVFVKIVLEVCAGDRLLIFDVHLKSVEIQCRSNGIRDKSKNGSAWYRRLRLGVRIADCAIYRRQTRLYRRYTGRRYSQT